MTKKELFELLDGVPDDQDLHISVEESGRDVTCSLVRVSFTADGRVLLCDAYNDL